MEYRNTNENELILPTTVNLDTDKGDEIISSLRDAGIKCNCESNDNNVSITFSIEDIEALNRLLQPFGINKKIDDMDFTMPKTEKKEKLLPFLNTVSNLYERKLNASESRIKSHSNHIKLVEGTLKDKNKQLEKLLSQNEMLKGFGNTFGILKNPINALVKRNEKKIERLQKRTIPKLEQNIQIHQNTIDKLNMRADKHKLRRSICRNLSSVIKSFGISDKTERSSVYLTAMTALNSDLISKNNEKVNEFNAQVNNIKSNWTALTAPQQSQAQQKLLKITKQIQTLQAKNAVLSTANADYRVISDNSIADKGEKALGISLSKGSLDDAISNAAINTANTLSSKAAHVKKEMLDPIMDKDGDHIPDRLDSEFNPEVTRFYEEKDRNENNLSEIITENTAVPPKQEVQQAENSKIPEDCLIEIVSQKQYDALKNAGIHFRSSSKERKKDSIPIMFSKTDKEQVEKIIASVSSNRKAMKK